MSNVGDNERLMVLVEARITDLERNMRRASEVTGTNFNRMRRDAASATRAMEADVIRSTTRINQAIAATSGRIGSLAATYAGGRGMRGMGVGGIAGALGAYVSAQSARQLTDSATQITNALKVAGLEGDKLTQVYDRLFASAQKNSAPLEALVTLYGRAAIVQNELNVSSEELLSFTDNVALALRVAGTDATQASGALLQLSQALGAGTVRAEEFNSILEGALPIAQAAAAGIEEAGGSVAKLRALVVDGKVSSEAFFRGFEAGAQLLEEKVAGAESTVSQAFVRLMNVLTDTAGKLDDGSGASERMSDALDDLGGWISETDFSPLIEGVMDFASSVGLTIRAVNALGGALGDLTGLSNFGEFIRGERSQRNTDRTIARAFGSEGEGVVGNLANHGDGTGGASGTQRAILAAALQRQAGSLTTEVTETARATPISIDDYAAPTSGSGGKGGKGGKSAATRQNEYERETEQLGRRTAAILAETKAVAGLNPLMDDYGFALEKARAEHDLLTSAQQAGIVVTPELRSQIDQLAESYATAVAEGNRLAESQDEIRRRADDMRALGKETMGGFISDLTNGPSAADAFANAIGRIGDRLLDLALDGLFSPKKGGGGGGIFGALGSIFGGFREHGGPVSAGKAYIVGEKRPEVFVPDRPGAILPSVPTASPSMTVHSSPVFHVDARGAQVGAAEEIEQRMRKIISEYDDDLSRTIGIKIANARGMNRSGF